MNNSSDIIKSYLSSSASLVSFMEKSLDPWIVKDQHSRLIYMNRPELDELNLPVTFEYEGKLDKEIPAKPCAELWEEFVSHDQKSENICRCYSLLRKK